MKTKTKHVDLSKVRFNLKELETLYQVEQLVGYDVMTSELKERKRILLMKDRVMRRD